MTKYMVVGSKPRLYMVEAPSEQAAKTAVIDAMIGCDLNPGCRVERDPEGDDSPKVEAIYTFDEYFGDDDKPNF